MSVLAALTNEQITALRARARVRAEAVLVAPPVPAPDPAIVSNPATRTPTTIRDYDRDHAHFMRDRRRRQAAEEILVENTIAEEDVLLALHADATDDGATLDARLDTRCTAGEVTERVRRAGR